MKLSIPLKWWKNPDWRWHSCETKLGTTMLSRVSIFYIIDFHIKMYTRTRTMMCIFFVIILCIIYWILCPKLSSCIICMSLLFWISNSNLYTTNFVVQSLNFLRSHKSPSNDFTQYALMSKINFWHWNNIGNELLL